MSEDYRIDIGGGDGEEEAFSWSPLFPVGQDVWFKVDPEPWVYNRESVKVDYSSFAFLRDLGASGRVITVSGITSSDDRSDMLSELDNFDKLHLGSFSSGGEAANRRYATIFAGTETYDECYLMSIDNLQIEPAADPLYFIRYKLNFMQFPDGDTSDYVAEAAE